MWVFLSFESSWCSFVSFVALCQPYISVWAFLEVMSRISGATHVYRATFGPHMHSHVVGFTTPLTESECQQCVQYNIFCNKGNGYQLIYRYIILMMIEKDKGEVQIYRRSCPSLNQYMLINMQFEYNILQLFNYVYIYVYKLRKRESMVERRHLTCYHRQRRCVQSIPCRRIKAKNMQQCVYKEANKAPRRQ